MPIAQSDVSRGGTRGLHSRRRRPIFAHSFVPSAAPPQPLGEAAGAPAALAAAGLMPRPAQESEKKKAVKVTGVCWMDGSWRVLPTPLLPPIHLTDGGARLCAQCVGFCQRHSDCLHMD